MAPVGVRSPELPPSTPQAGPIETRPDPAYAAALSENAILIDARARAFELAMLRSRPAPGICWPSYAEIEAVANEILAYILNGKQP